MLIDQEGKSLGVTDINKAISMAYDANLDLVCVAPQAQPPVCKILNYSKFRYEKEKKEKEAIKNQKIVDTKEVQLSPTIAQHDFETKLNQAKKFLQHGDKVKVTLRIKRRFVTLTDQALENVNEFVNGLSEFGQAEKKPEFDGKLIQVTVSPKKVSTKKTKPQTEAKVEELVEESSEE